MKAERWESIVFFFFGIMPVEKRLPYTLGGICSHCGQACDYEVYLVANCFSLFFIPLFRFGKKYLVRMSCCGNVYLLQTALGKALEAGEQIALSQKDLIAYSGDFSVRSVCPHCGSPVEDHFLHCPRCGGKLK